METKWDCVTSRHLSHLTERHTVCPDSVNCLHSVNWPECPSFLFHSISFFSVFPFFHFFFWTTPFPVIPSFFLYVSLDPDTVSDDVTPSSDLTVWGESYYFAPVVWVKSPLTEIRELCLLGPTLLQLPHRHTWRAFQNVLLLVAASYWELYVAPTESYTDTDGTEWAWST